MVVFLNFVTNMKSIFTILLAVLMFLSNFGFALGTHFCGGKAVESKLVLQHNDLHCGMDLSTLECDDHNAKGEFVKNKCCNNDFLDLDTDDNFNLSSSHNLEIQPLQILTLVSIFLDAIWSNSTDDQFTVYRDPHIPIKNCIQSLYQVFII